MVPRMSDAISCAVLSCIVWWANIAGQRPDWDEIPQKETAGNADFSAQEYAQLLGEELDA